jgi:flavin-dependent dehydrogenase
MVHEKFDTLINTVKAKTDLDFTKLSRVEGAIILRPVSIKQLCFVKGQAALIGEASGCISPTSAEGFSYALKSGRLLAHSLTRHGANSKALKAYDRSCLKLRFSILFKLMKYPGMYHPVLRKWVMRSAITSKNPKKGV